jgi:hypothetical protein
MRFCGRRIAPRRDSVAGWPRYRRLPMRRGSGEYDTIRRHSRYAPLTGRALRVTIACDVPLANPIGISGSRVHERRLLAALLAVAAIFAGTVVLAAAPAQAHTNCAYPYVCIYNVTVDPDRKLQYRDFGYQLLPSNARNTVDHILNTRHDDRVKLWDIDHGQHWICFGPGAHENLGDFAPPWGGTWANDVDAIEIQTQASCGARQG